MSNGLSRPREKTIAHQRSSGSVHLRASTSGLETLRESGSAKIRALPGAREAILINTSGGLAGGDDLSIRVEAGAGASLAITTQAAERVYRSLGPAANVDISLVAGGAATLLWLPQETILFEGASLKRRINAELATDSRFLAIESIVLGREAMGETITTATLRDSWRVSRTGCLIFAEEAAFAGTPTRAAAALGSARALATLLFAAEDAESAIDAVRGLCGPTAAASSTPGKLVARFVARDSLELRKALIPVLRLLAGAQSLPRIWSS